MAEPSRGLLDTSVVIDHDLVDHDLLPDESAISAVTLAELAAGPHATSDDGERARRQDRLQWAAANWDPLPSTRKLHVPTGVCSRPRRRRADRTGLASPIS